MANAFQLNKLNEFSVFIVVIYMVDSKSTVCIFYQLICSN